MTLHDAIYRARDIYECAQGDIRYVGSVLRAAGMDRLADVLEPLPGMIQEADKMVSDAAHDDVKRQIKESNEREALTLGAMLGLASQIPNKETQ